MTYFQETIKARQFEQNKNYEEAITHWERAKALVKSTRFKDHCQKEIDKLECNIN